MKVVVAKTQKELLDNVLVRGKVFVVEQEIDWDIEFDGLDDICVLFTAYIDDIPVGAARLYKNKVGRVATLKEYRKKGIASEIMKKIEEYALDNNIKLLKLNAQLHVKDFYLHLGYIPEGDIFQEADIDHIKMTKVIKNG
jgi:predicted GNAT family N-acyltransferase